MRRLVLLAALLLTGAPPAAARLPLHPCTLGGTSGLCGRIVVPENRAQPAGRTISLRVTVLRATGGRPRPDPVFYLAGGPGTAATALASTFRVTFADLNFDRDVVLVDQRGTGGSNPLACPEVPAVKNQAQADAYVRRCAAGLKGDARRYGTVDAVDDLDAVRRALGYATIDLYGTSYGATAAQVFLNRHPDAVRAVVLDGGTLLGVPILERFGSNGQRALDVLARRCAAEPACARAFPGWPDRLGRLLAHLRKTPVTTPVDGRRVTLGAADVASIVQTMTLNAEDAAQIPLAVTRAAKGDWAPLVGVALRPASLNAPPRAVMPYSILCNEPWAVRDPAAVAADARGTYLAAAARAWARQQAVVCHAFPKRSERASDWQPPRGPTPLLAVVGGADPQDPIGNIAGIRKTMPNSAFAVVPGAGHTVGQYGCMPSLVARFFERGSVRGLDLSCVRQVPPPAFRLR